MESSSACIYLHDDQRNTNPPPLSASLSRPARTKVLLWVHLCCHSSVVVGDRAIHLTLCPNAVSSFITVSPDAPLPMIAILDLGLGDLLKQSPQLQGTGGGAEAMAGGVRRSVALVLVRVMVLR